jgi:methyltransferase (TIGR00027 family)
MARTENDTWDLASSVGATATAVAASRAMASQGPDRLLNDPWADPLVRAVGIDTFIKLIDGKLGANHDPVLSRQAMNEQITVRTRFFDDFFIQSGLGQAVIVASGLDSRPYRLRWPVGSVVYEIDQPKVIEFKSTTMASIGATPTAEHHAVSIDLRDDWPDALHRNGFDETQPTAWIAEGLLVYLPPEAQDRLFDNITALSAPGSQLATEYNPDAGAVIGEGAKTMNAQWREHGFDVDLSQLYYPGERNSVEEYLGGHGWQVTTRPRPELFAEYGREFHDTEELTPLRNSRAIIATRR